jgi:hypothetical protein
MGLAAVGRAQVSYHAVWFSGALRQAERAEQGPGLPGRGVAPILPGSGGSRLRVVAPLGFHSDDS